MKFSYLLPLVLIPIILLSGCIQQQPDVEKIKQACIKACEDVVNSGGDLYSGPCLMDPMQDYYDWVCDVAHEPRQAVDDQPENQCSAFREGKASHFVEVTPDCKFIQSH